MTDGEIAEMGRLMLLASPLPWRIFAKLDGEGQPLCLDLAFNKDYLVAAANAVPGLLGEIERLKGKITTGEDS